jgi:hypothetical protein
MPIHDWQRVKANRFHDFHQSWIQTLRIALNNGVLPDGYFAMAEQIMGGPVPDVVTLATPNVSGTRDGGLAIATAPLQMQHHASAAAKAYAQRANRLAIHHPDGDVVAVIEIVSPGNKDSQHAIKSFARKAVQFLDAGIHLLIVDLFPPSKRDPHGIHRIIWDRIKDDDYLPPTDKSLTAVAYSSGNEYRAYVQPLAIGDVLPDMPIFLTSDRYVLCPLEATYQQAWDVYPRALKAGMEGPASA